MRLNNPTKTVSDILLAGLMNPQRKENSIQKHVSPSTSRYAVLISLFVPDKGAIDNMSPGDAVVVFTPDSWFSFRAWIISIHDT